MNFADVASQIAMRFWLAILELNGQTRHGVRGPLSPIEGSDPEDLKIAELNERVRRGEIREVVVA